MIPQIQPWIDESELIELKKVIGSTYISESTLTAEFEARTRELTGAKHAIAMSNGTVALYCALRALGIGHGDEVIVPNITFIASANAVLMAGATPIFSEVDGDTFCIDINEAQSLVSSRTKAIMPVHLYGQAADMDLVITFAKKNGLFVIEDASQGVGVFFKKQHVGTFGEVGVLSYFANKTITCGEGGIVLTNDDDLAKACYRLKNHGRDVKGTFIHDHIGFNFSFTEMQAAIGVSQMKKLPKIINKKLSIRNEYLKAFQGVEGFTPTTIDQRVDPVFWFTSYLVDDAEDFSRFMMEHEVQTRRFFYPLHLQPCYRNLYDFSNRDFGLSEKIYKQGISLPSSFLLTDDEIGFVIDKALMYFK